MMDLSRHFYPVSFIEHTIEAMVANKLNVLHLHLTDDASFPVALASHPELASKGAFGDDYVYSTSQLAQLDAFADTHGVRIVPEFDMPAHSSSWRAGIPSMVVAGFEGCSSSPFLHGDVLDPTTNVTYDVIQRVVSEIKSTFANAPIVHLGGDEVPTACWLNSPNVTAFMKTEGFESAEELVGYFLKRVASTIEEDVKAKSASSSITKMYWEEAFTNDNGSSIPRDAIVHVWKQNSAVASAAVATGRRCVLSSGFYLNHGPNNYGDGLWEDFYENEPSSYSASPLLLGGAAAMWSERVDQYNFDGIVWPRAAATAEVLWSPQNYTQAGATANVSHRLAVHRCRMVSRGVRSGPLNDMNDPRVWYLADDYIFVDNRELSGWVSVFLGVVVLCMIAHFQSVLAAPMTILSDRSDRRVRWSNALQKPIFGKRRVGIDNGDCESTGASSISNITLSETPKSDTEAGPFAVAGGSL
eukprot:g2502.t1